jgi:hypothetical protein
MSWVLTVIGALAVLASSVPLYSGITSPSEIGPLYYIVSAVLFLGGLALLGLADVARQLRGIAEGSMARPLGRVAATSDLFEAAPAAPAAESAAPAVPPAPRIPFPPKTASRARAPAAEPRLDRAPSIDTASDHFERPAPSFARPALEPRRAPEPRIAPEPAPEPEHEHEEAPLSPAEPRFSAKREDKDDLSDELLATAFSRLDVSMRPAPPMNEAAKQRGMFEAAWPPERTMPSEPEPEKREPAMEEPPAEAQEAPYAVSILKSGVVDGMAYTLYSDGSIEAEMPQGTMRFASITELRGYLEKSSP